MKIVFFQDIVSMHFASFFRELSNSNKVYLFVDELITQKRLNQGWEVPDTGTTKIFVNKDSDFTRKFIDENDESYFIFSGLHSVKSSILAFKHTIKKKDRYIGILSEGYKSHDFKTLLRIIRSRLFYLKYGKKIKFIFAIGDIAVKWYVKSGFSEKVVYNWTYFVDNKKSSLIPKTEKNNKFALLFVGELNANKRILNLIDVVKDISDVDLKVVGEGKFTSKVKTYSEIYDNIQYLGILENSLVFEIMKNSDLLILPSKHDGWGAVTNESLLAGTPVLCTNTCGSSVLLDGRIRGESYKWSKKRTRKLILKWKGKDNLEVNRNIIIKWSANLLAENAISYFTDVMHYVSKKTNDLKPKAPWI